MLNKPVQQLDEADLLQAVADELPEGKTLDYKQDLPGGTDQDRIHFLADVSAMANAAGGLLLYGVVERRDGRDTTGIPESVPGLDINPDKEIRRLDDMMVQSITPPIQGVFFHPIRLSNGNTVLAIKVPRSWNGPHVVDHGKYWRFHVRSAAGNRKMDYDEVRAAMTMADTVTQRLRQFRLERLGRIAAGETPVPMPAGAKTVLHILPLGMSDARNRLDVAELARDNSLYGMLLPLRSGASYRTNLDGLLVFDTGDSTCGGYVQLFRSGVLEVVDHQLLRNGPNADPPFIPSTTVEEALLQSTRQYFKALQQIGVDPPISVGLSLLSVRGYKLATSSGLWRHRYDHVDRDDLVIPEVVVDDITQSSEAFMRPVLDMLWQACGYTRSLNYDEQGRWGRR